MQSSWIWIGIAVLGVFGIVVGITTFLWLPLLIIAVVGLFSAPLWGMLVSQADDYREAGPKEL